MISTHILDTSSGKPANGVSVRLQISQNNTWKDIGSGTTNSDGRLSFDCESKSGLYQLIFEVEHYFASTKTECFFPSVTTQFKISDTKRKYHVPLLLNPFGYSTYRGS